MPKLLITESMTIEELYASPEGRKRILELALKRLNFTRRYYQAHDDEVRNWYRNGEGREGYRFPHCIHGSSLITDYDNICGGCEEGYTYFDYERDGVEAIAYAKRCFAEYFHRSLLYWNLVNAGYDEPHPIWHWAIEAISGKELI